MLKTQSVIDMIAMDLLKVPNGTYTFADTEWRDGRSDVLYTPRLGIQKSLPPILIEIQKIVNESFMQRLVHYGHNIFQIYHSYPIVLIFCIDRVTPSSLMMKFEEHENNKWLFAIKCSDFWAKYVYLVSRYTLINIDNDAGLTPLQALSTFFIQQSPTIYGHSHTEDATVQKLYIIAKKISEEHSEIESNYIDTVNVICSNNEKILDKVRKALNGIPNILKAKNLIHRGKEYNNSIKRKYSSASDSDSSFESLPKLRLTSTSISEQSTSKDDEYQFIINFKEKKIGKMNWEFCLKEAQKKDLCTRFSSGASLRAFFNNYKIGQDDVVSEL